MEATIELVDLKNKFKLLRSRSHFFNEEARRFVDLRNSLNRKTSSMIKEAKIEKEKRNDLNKKVSKLKKERDKYRAQLNKLIQEFKELDSHLKDTRGKNSTGKIKKQIRQMEWTLQTKNLTPSEEKGLIERIDKLESQLDGLPDPNIRRCA